MCLLPFSNHGLIVTVSSPPTQSIARESKSQDCRMSEPKTTISSRLPFSMLKKGNDVTLVTGFVAKLGHRAEWLIIESLVTHCLGESYIHHFWAVWLWKLLKIPKSRLPHLWSGNDTYFTKLLETGPCTEQWSLRKGQLFPLNICMWDPQCSLAPRAGSDCKIPTK